MSAKTKLDISLAIKEHWLINNKNILDSKSKNEGYKIFKFCYQPDSGEFLCDIWPSNHKEIIQTYGMEKFNDYVRGIYFKEKKIVYLRQHENKKFLLRTKEFLRKHGVPNTVRIIWGRSASEKLRYELRGL